MATNNSNGKPIRVVGYCRTSGEGQRDNTSIGRQKQAIGDFCVQGGHAFIRHYVDESKSGSKIAGRDDFQEMMRDAANGKFDQVIVYDITRFARDGFDIIESSRTLKRDFGINVVCTKGQFDSRNPRNTLLNFVHAGVSEHERISIMDRMTGSRIAKAKQGKPWTCNPPIGRAFDKETGSWHITEKGRAIVQVLERYTQGESLKVLCSELGIARTSKISQWVWHGQLAGTYKAKFKSPEIGIDVEVPVPGIPELVPFALIEKARARLSHNRTFNRHDCRSYVLTGFIRCGDCERALSGQTPGETVYYRHNDANSCTVKAVKGNQIEPAVLDYLYDAFLDQPEFDQAVKRTLPPANHRKSLLQERSQTEKRLAKNDREITRLVDAIVIKGADPSLMVSKQDQLIAEKEILTKRLAELETEIANLPSEKQTKRSAMMTRLRLAREHKGKDWRKMPYEQVKPTIPGWSKIALIPRRKSN